MVSTNYLPVQAVSSVTRPNGGPNGGKNYFERFPPKKGKAKRKRCREKNQNEKDEVNKRRRERYQNEKDEVNKGAREKYQQEKNSPKFMAKRVEKTQQCKQILLDARIFSFAEDRNNDELEDDLWYIGKIKAKHAKCSIKSYHKRKNDPEVKRKQAERAQQCKQIRLDAQVYDFVNDRNEDELTRKAQGMADELSGKMHPNINDDDLWYIGGACTW